MTGPLSDRPDLTPEEGAFVRSIASFYTAPQPSAAERVAFNAKLEQRVARRRTAWRRAPAFAGAAVVAALGVFVLARATVVTPRPGEISSSFASAASTTAESAILALATDSPEEPEEALPEDYLAIEDVFLGG
jgi:hypothetical protein